VTDVRRALASTIAAILLATGAACTKVATNGATANGPHPWTVAGQLRIGYPDEPDGLNPMYTNTAAADEADALLLAPVFRYDQRGEFFPELATEVPSYRNGGISADGRTITLRWRRGVVWADGAPLTARDLRFTWRVVMDPRNNTKTRAGWDDITAIDTRDPYTAVVHLKKPNADVLGIFASGGAAYPPLPEHLLGKFPDLNRAQFNVAPLSSGPWILEHWNHGSSLEFAPNPRYWRGPPKLTHITWRVLPNADTQLAQLTTHEIDVYPNVSENQIARLGTIAGIATQTRLVANWRHLDFNTRKPALADARVRQAIAQGVDWNRINATVYLGVNQRAVSDIVPTSWAAPSIPQWHYDPAAARRLLDAAGFVAGPDGLRRRGAVALRLALSTGTNKPANERAEVQIQQALRPLGIDVEIKNYAVSYLFAQNGPLYGGTYDMSWSVDTNGPDPDNQPLWSGDFIPPHGANTSYYSDPVITQTSEAAIRTYDRAKRKALYQREEERIHALALAVFFYWENATSAYNSDLHGYRPAQYITDNWNSWEWQI
jgi:peptide/nickel transport system substrate-binding protein